MSLTSLLGGKEGEDTGLGSLFGAAVSKPLRNKVRKVPEVDKKTIKENNAKLAKALSAVRKLQKKVKEEAIPAGKMKEDKALNKAKSAKNKEEVIRTEEELAEANQRTLFIGNVPLKMTDSQLKRLVKSVLPYSLRKEEIPVSELHIVKHSKTIRCPNFRQDRVVTIDGKKILRDDDLHMAKDGNDDTEMQNVEAEEDKVFNDARDEIIEQIEKDQASTPEKKVTVEIESILRLDSIRFRSLPAAPEFVNRRKAAHCLGRYSDHASGKNAYVVIEKNSAFCIQELVKKLENVEAEEGFQLRVDLAEKSKKISEGNDERSTPIGATDENACSKDFSRKKSIFVGNLAVDATENQLRNVFKDSGINNEDIEKIRIVRDKQTLLSKGFGFIQFSERKIANEIFKACANFEKVKSRAAKGKGKGKGKDPTDAPYQLNGRELRCTKVMTQESASKEKKEKEEAVKSAEPTSVFEKVKMSKKKKPLKSLTTRERRTYDRSKEWFKKQKEVQKSDVKGTGKGKGRGKGAGKGGKSSSKGSSSKGKGEGKGGK